MRKILIDVRDFTKAQLERIFETCHHDVILFYGGDRPAYFDTINAGRVSSCTAVQIIEGNLEEELRPYAKDDALIITYQVLRGDLLGTGSCSVLGISAIRQLLNDQLLSKEQWRKAEFQKYDEWRHAEFQKYDEWRHAEFQKYWNRPPFLRTDAEYQKVMDHIDAEHQKVMDHIDAEHQKVMNRTIWRSEQSQTTPSVECGEFYALLSVFADERFRRLELMLLEKSEYNSIMREIKEELESDAEESDAEESDAEESDEEESDEEKFVPVVFTRTPAGTYARVSQPWLRVSPAVTAMLSDFGHHWSKTATEDS